MIGKIFITRTGYDPQRGKHVKDPYLNGPKPTLGACRPDVRRRLNEGDHLFVISGKVPGANQYVMGGFEVDTKIPASEAFRRFPALRLRMRDDGQLTGNIIVDSNGNQHPLDDHDSFDERIKDYIVGRNSIVICDDREIDRARNETLEVLRDILKRQGQSPFELIGRSAMNLTEGQVKQLRQWLESLKASR